MHPPETGRCMAQQIRFMTGIALSAISTQASSWAFVSHILKFPAYSALEGKFSFTGEVIQGHIEYI